jgi:hypothetical protein
MSKYKITNGAYLDFVWAGDPAYFKFGAAMNGSSNYVPRPAAAHPGRFT